MTTSRRMLILEQLGLLPLWVPRGMARDAGQTKDPLDQGPMVQTPVVAPVQPDAMGLTGPDDRGERIGRMSWPELKEAVRGCAACPLHVARTQSVFGVGDEQADWLFVGEGPGAEEDARGEPFVGQAGKLLDNMLAAIGIKRGHDVYIANIVKCRPPGNRVPDPREAEQCAPFLRRQIALIQPRLIVALGKTAASHLLSTEASLGSLRGRVHDFHGTALLVTYHPAYLLRNPPDKAKAWEDLCLARETMQRLKSEQSAPI